MTYLQYIIPAVSLIVVQIIISLKQQRVQDIRFDAAIDKIKEDIERLEQKQDKHNQLIERMVKVEASEQAQWDWIDSFKDRLP